MTTQTDKTLLRAGYAEHLGCWLIRALLPAKTRAGCSSEPLPNDNPANRSWQQIHKTGHQGLHNKELAELLGTGRYELE